MQRSDRENYNYRIDWRVSRIVFRAVVNLLVAREDRSRWARCLHDACLWVTWIRSWVPEDRRDAYSDERWCLMRVCVRLWVGDARLPIVFAKLSILIRFEIFVFAEKSQKIKWPLVLSQTALSLRKNTQFLEWLKHSENLSHRIHKLCTPHLPIKSNSFAYRTKDPAKKHGRSEKRAGGDDAVCCVFFLFCSSRVKKRGTRFAGRSRVRARQLLGRRASLLCLRHTSRIFSFSTMRQMSDLSSRLARLMRDAACHRCSLWL